MDPSHSLVSRFRIMAEISFQCPECGHSYRFGSDLAGKRGRCKACQAVFRIPEANPTPPPGPALTPPPRASETGKVDVNCPRCGHSYRLDAKLAGKQARCTSCREPFTIPAGSVPRPSRPMMTFNDPLTNLAARSATPAPAVRTSGGDSGYWELDSSESIPTTTTRPAAARSRPAPIITATPLDDDGIVTAGPVRTNWVVWASVGGGGVVGLILILILFKALSGKPTPTPEPNPSADPPVVATPGPGPSKPETAVDRHREALDSLVRAYNRIADGYAHIHDARSIADGQTTIRAAVEDLRTASQRGQDLPALPPDDRRKLIQQQAPRLIQAVDRVIGELRRLQGTSGLRSDFDGLIASYSQTVDEIRHELDASRSEAPG